MDITLRFVIDWDVRIPFQSLLLVNRNAFAAKSVLASTDVTSWYQLFLHHCGIFHSNFLILIAYEDTKEKFDELLGHYLLLKRLQLVAFFSRKVIKKKHDHLIHETTTS